MASSGAAELADLGDEISRCRGCPRLVSWREDVARERRAAYRHEEYWGRPVPGFGDADAEIVVIGLAPAAHGANRTGRMFTGDRSGDWLYRALFRAGLANQASSTSRDDGLALTGVYVSAAVHCAPPANRPTSAERDRCATFMIRELELLTHARVLVALGGFGYEALWKVLAATGAELPRPRPRFAHLAEVRTERFAIVCSYHPSQQNTFTGRLTEDMFDAVFVRALDLAAHSRTGHL